jgi:hypothetical protein
MWVAVSAIAGTLALAADRIEKRLMSIREVLGRILDEVSKR